MRIAMTIALSCFVALALFQGTLSQLLEECPLRSRRCNDPTRGVNLSGTVLVEDADADDCAACGAACERLYDQCNVWVWCDNPDGCDDGHGKIYPHKTCTLKRQDNIHAIVTDPFGDETILTAAPENIDTHVSHWVSGYCNVCPCCGWCFSALVCCSNYRYCKDTGRCVDGQLSADFINAGGSSNCKDPVNDLLRTDCVTEPDQCNAINPLCPSGSDWFDGIGSLASDWSDGGGSPASDDYIRPKATD